MMKVEDFINNKVGMNTLRVLIEMDMPLPLSRIARITKSNFVTTRKRVQPLLEEKMIETMEYGKRTLFRANTDHGIVSAFANFLWEFEEWSKEEKRP